MTRKWIRIRRPHLCPVCRHNPPSGCSLSADGKASVCIRVESGKRMPGNGMGWLHRLDQPLPPPPAPKEKPVPVADFAEAVDRWQRDASDARVRLFANSLGVTADALRRLRIGWDGDAWTFPMSDAAGRVVGVRRRFIDGRKLSVKGGHEGCFVPINTIGDMTDEVYICEGPTDTAYLLGLGIAAIGRPSCQGAVEIIKALVGRMSVVIVADADGPGQKGATGLADALYRPGRCVRIVTPNRGKDVREWKPGLATLMRFRRAAAVYVKGGNQCG